MSAKDDFLKQAKTVDREGMTDLLNYLESTDFFTAPASSKYHGSCPKGLLLHSLSVFDVMKEINSMIDTGIDEDSITVCGLFHDVCKINFYEEDNEEATDAQLRYVRQLCEEKDVAMPSKDFRTKAFISNIISALKAGKPMPVYKHSYKITDKLPMGHGEKSVYIIQKYMQLTDEEAIAIRWHLGGSDPAAWNSPMGNPSIQAFHENKLLALVAGADILVSFLIDE